MLRSYTHLVLNGGSKGGRVGEVNGIEKKLRHSIPSTRENPRTKIVERRRERFCMYKYANKFSTTARQKITPFE